MRRRRAVRGPALAGLLWLLGARPALAADRPCSALALEVDSAVRDHWPDLAEHVREAFAERDDIDACARVSLTKRGAAITVRVDLPDGRSASRSVPRREDVLAVLEALLLVPLRSPALGPKPEVEAALVSAASAVDVRVAPPDIAATRTPRDGLAEARAESAAPLRIELSVGPGARIGDGHAGFGAFVLSFLEVSRWLVGFEGRLDAYRELGDGSSAGALSLGLLGGRRLPFRSVAFDVVAGPALVYQGLSSTMQELSSSMTNTQSLQEKFIEYRSAIVPRWIVGSRVNFGARSTLRTFVAIEGEVGPSGASDESRRVDAPRLPVWTLGLAVGATVGTP